MGKGGCLEPLVLLAADAANGLEFDSVVVVEPGVIAGETARGLRTLYVALTRPTRRLSVVYLAPPPAAPRLPPPGTQPSRRDRRLRRARELGYGHPRRTATAVSLASPTGPLGPGRARAAASSAGRALLMSWPLAHPID